MRAVRAARGSRCLVGAYDLVVRRLVMCYNQLMFAPIKNPSDQELVALIRSSPNTTARRIVDPRNGDAWYWPAEQATHREGADTLGIPYDRLPGAGDIVVL